MPSSSAGAARALFWASAAGDLLEAASRGLLHLAAGTLGHAELNAMTVRTWRTFQAKDVEPLAGFMPWEAEIYSQHTKPGDRILIIGCGTGRDMLPFLDRGHEVVGLEPAPEPLASFRELLDRRGQAAMLVEGFIETAPLPGTFDCALFSWICYSYLRERKRRVAAMQRLGEHLNPGGRIIINYIARDPARRSRAIRLARWTAKVTGSDWTPEDHDVIRIERGDSGERLLSFEHWFTPEEIEAEASDAGLRIISRDGPVGVPILVAGR